MEKSSFWRANSTKHFFLNLMFKLFLEYFNGLLVFWMDDILIYSQTEEHLKHSELVFEKFREASIELKIPK